MNIAEFAEKICRFVFTMIMTLVNLVKGATGEDEKYSPEDFSHFAG